MNKKVAGLLMAGLLAGCGQSLDEEVRSMLKAPELVELKDLRRSKDGNHVCGMIQGTNLAGRILMPWTRFSTVGKDVQIIYEANGEVGYADEYRQRCL